MDVNKNVLEVTEVKRLRWFGLIRRRPWHSLLQRILEWESEVLGGNGRARERERERERWMDRVRRTVTNHRLTERDPRERGMWRNFGWRKTTVRWASLCELLLLSLLSVFVICLLLLHFCLCVRMFVLFVVLTTGLLTQRFNEQELNWIGLNY
jgi:hypothetical protein